MISRYPLFLIVFVTTIASHVRAFATTQRSRDTVCSRNVACFASMMQQQQQQGSGFQVDVSEQSPRNGQNFLNWANVNGILIESSKFSPLTATTTIGVRYLLKVDKPAIEPCLFPVCYHP